MNNIYLEILLAQKAAGKFINPDIDGFLQKRYDRDKKLRDMFISHGGKPTRTTPVYMMLGEHKQWESAYENLAVIKIPLEEFDRLSVSFTYGDSFAIFNPSLFGKEEYWNRLYFVDEIKDSHINHHLKYVEAHVWSDDVLDKYRNIWFEENEL